MIAFSRGVEFKCNIFKTLVWSSPIGSVYTCDHPEVTEGNDSLIVESIYANHTSRMSNIDVTGLFVTGQMKFQRIPARIEMFLPNLKVLLWDYGNLTSITSDELRPFPELKLLSLFKNKIVSLDSDLFQYTPKLFEIDFAWNLLANVEFDLLANLNELTYAYFYNNPCIDVIAQGPEAILELKKKLMMQCPPLATTITSTTMSPTTLGFCDVRCTMNEEVDKLKETLDEQSKKNEERFLELEKQMRKIHGQP